FAIPRCRTTTVSARARFSMARACMNSASQRMISLPTICPMGRQRCLPQIFPMLKARTSLKTQRPGKIINFRSTTRFTRIIHAASTVPFPPDDATFFLSSGVMRFDPPAGMYPDLYERRQNQIAIQGLFAPTASWDGENNELLTSSYPSMTDPAMAVDIYRGDA